MTSILEAIQGVKNVTELKGSRNCSGVTAVSRFRGVRLCDTTDHSPPGSSAYGILQERRLEWAAMLSSRGSWNTGIEHASLTSPALAGGAFTTRATWEALSVIYYRRLSELK